MLVIHPATHTSLSADRTYPLFLIPPKASINCTTLTSNRLLTILLTLSCLFYQIFSDCAIDFLALTIVQLVWKSEKCLTHGFTFHIIQNCTCVILLFLIDHRHSLQATPEPVNGFGQCDLSCFSLLFKAPCCCSATSSTLGSFIPKAFSDAIILVTIDYSMSSFLFWSCHLFSITPGDEIVVLGVDPSFFLMHQRWTAETRWSRPPTFLRLIFSKQTRRQKT